jgi:hypothetical protein
MKKAFVFFALFIGVNLTLFSLSETWVSMGLEYGFYFENVSDYGDNLKQFPFKVYTGKSTMNSLGVNFKTYKFWNDNNVGLFTHNIIAFPKIGTTNKPHVDLDTDRFLVQVGLIIGPGFRYNFNDNVLLQFGLGLNIMGTILDFNTPVTFIDLNSGLIFSDMTEYGTLAFNFGVGADIGIKFDLTDNFFINIGSIATIDFANSTTVLSAFNNGGDWAKKYSMFGVRPYLCIGLNMHSAFTNLGKPKNNEDRSIIYPWEGL